MGVSIPRVDVPGTVGFSFTSFGTVSRGPLTEEMM